MTTNARRPRSRFYDGAIYARLLDPLLLGLHAYVADQLEANQKVLDAGCGTGALTFRVAEKAAEVVGVELSPAMVAYANRRLRATPFNHVTFVVGDLTDALADRPEGSFDVATLVMTLHEMPAEARAPVLSELTRVARKVLCVDYRVPMPWNLAGIRNRIIEATAGVEHFRAFRDFCRRGGTPGIGGDANLDCEHLRHIDARSLEVSIIRR